MITVSYTELDGAHGPTARLEASGHAAYAEPGQDIICAGASILMQTLACMLEGEENTRIAQWEEEEGPRLAVTAAAPQGDRVTAALDFAKTGFALLAESWPEYLSFEDRSRHKEPRLDLQLFAEAGTGAEQAAPALSHAQQQQAVAAGTMKAQPGQEAAAPPAAPAPKQEAAEESKAPAQQTAARPQTPAMPPAARNAVRALHSRWAAEEGAMRRVQPGFNLRQELKNPEMRRLMALPGMRMQDAWRLTHYEDSLRQTARAVEQGVMERVRQRSGRPAENGTRPGGAAAAKPDVAHMSRAEREALERQALHGVMIRF